MMNNKLNLTIFITALFFTSCGTPEKKINVQPETSSAHHMGKAVITEIADSKNEDGSENIGYMDVYFKFILSDPSQSKKYICTKCFDNKIKMFYDNRDSFHKTWINKWNINPGNEYPAIRHELLRKDNTTAVSYEIFLEPKN